MLTVWVFEELSELKECITLRSSTGLNSWVNTCQMHSLESEIPEIGELDELETFVCSKKTIVVKLAGIVVFPTGKDKQQENDEKSVVQAVCADAVGVENAPAASSLLAQLPVLLH